VGVCHESPTVNINEVSAWRFVSAKALEQEFQSSPDTLTPWFKLEWETILRDHKDALLSMKVDI